MSSSGQIEPPGMHMIYLPYSDDIRHVEEVRRAFFLRILFTSLFRLLMQGNMQLHRTTDSVAPRATDEQIQKASNLLRRMELKDFAVSQFSNPGAFQCSLA